MKNEFGEICYVSYSRKTILVLTFVSEILKKRRWLACRFLNLEFFVIVSTFLLRRLEETTNYLGRLDKANEIEKENLTSPFFFENPTCKSSPAPF